MKLMQRLLLALDFGDATHATVAHAIQLAKAFEAPLILLHVIEYIPYYANYPYADNGMREIHQHVDEELDEIQKTIEAAGVRVEERVVEVGRSHQVIVRVAEAKHATAIVMGAGRKSMVERLLAGTTAEKVVHTTHLPVFLHHPGDAETPIKHLLCAIDLDGSACCTLHTAVTLARMFKASLKVIHVTPQPAPYPNLPDLQVEVVDLARQPALPQAGQTAAADHDPATVMRQVLQRCDLAGIPFETQILHGKTP